MADNTDNYYRALQMSLDKLPISFPATASGVEIKILKHIFSPIQALVGSKLKFMPIPLTVIHERITEQILTLEELEKVLDDMHKQGLILRKIDTKEGKIIKSYAASAFILGFYEFQMDKMTEEYIRDVDQYFEEAYMEELNKTEIPQLRTIPIEEVVEAKNNVASYDDFRALLENCGEPIVLNECICRKKNDLTDRSCKVTDLRESCFSFRSAGQAYLDRGLGRIITKEEALQIIKQGEEEGLVIQAGNSQRPVSLCLCCGDCCNLLVSQKRFAAPAKYFGSNYHALVDEDLCTGCGICAIRCQMDAIEIVEGLSKIDFGRCIGCGVCVPGCPEEAITLLKKAEPQQTIPPRNTFETYKKIAKKKTELSQSK